MEVAGRIVDVVERRIFKGRLVVENGRIVALYEGREAPSPFILPGFIDAHIHIESSLLPPSEFARLSSIHGTVAAVCDPHEIANVLGLEGIEFMLENGKRVRFHFLFGAPPCVPATIFESSGASIGPWEIEELLRREEIGFLAEVMDVEGILEAREDLMAKIEAAKRRRKPIDGHAPGLRGEALKRYVACGIQTDHETEQLEEAEEKLANSMRLILRYGSASKAFERLLPVLAREPRRCMFGSDDKAPDGLVQGHIDEMVRKAVASGYELFDALYCACVAPREHYSLRTGLLKVGDSADFIIVDDLHSFNVLQTFVAGECVALRGRTLIPRVPVARPNSFAPKMVGLEDLWIPAEKGRIRVIEIEEGSLLTKMVTCQPKIENGAVVPDVQRDVLKAVVLERYKASRPGIGFVKGFGLKEGALASSILHDSHHVVALGTQDDLIVEALRTLFEARGGLCFVSKTASLLLPLPIAGLMSDEDGFLVASRYEEMNDLVRSYGCPLRSPFMSLSFIGLPVIPEIRLTTRGLFHVSEGKPVSLFFQGEEGRSDGHNCASSASMV